MESNNAKYLLNDIGKAPDYMTCLEPVNEHKRKSKFTRILANQPFGDTPNEGILQQDNGPVSDVGNCHDDGI